MDARLYPRRSLVGTVISVLKRKYGAAVRSRVWWRQLWELVAMCLVYFERSEKQRSYNLERAVKLGLSLLDLLTSWLLYVP